MGWFDNVPILGKAEDWLGDRFSSEEEEAAAADFANQIDEGITAQRGLIPEGSRPGQRRIAPERRSQVGANGKGESAGGMGVGSRGWGDDSFNGFFDPEMYQDPELVEFGGYDPSLVGRSNMWGVNADQNAIDAQTMALQGFQDIANQGGMTAIDRARIAEARAGEEQWLRGQRGALMNNMQARGLGGSGAELAGMLSDQQSSANRNAMSGLQTEAMAQQRAMDALGLTGQLGGQIRAQSFGEGAARAGAQDAFDTFNAGLQTDSNRFAADVANQQSEINTGRVNDVNDGNTDQRNQGQIINREDAWRLSNDEDADERWNYGAIGGLEGERRAHQGAQMGYQLAQAAADDAFVGNAVGAGVGAVVGGGKGAAMGAQMGGGGQAPAYQSFAPKSGNVPQYQPSPGYKVNDDDELMDWGG